MKLHLSLFTAAAFTVAAAAGAQNPVAWTVTPAAKAAVAGGTTSVKITAAIQDGWHIYSLTQPAGGPNPTRFTLPDSQPFTLGGAIVGPAPKVGFDETFNINVETHEKTAEFTIPVKIDKDAKPGTQQLHVNARYQVCNATSCIPGKVKLTADVKVKKGKSA